MKTSILTLGLLICTLGISAQDIKLPNPDMKAKSSTVIDALVKRHSTREFANTPLSNQELSNLCWAACGVSRDENHRTAPTAMNRQEVRLFVFTEKGVYEYDAKANTLTEKAKGDKRGLIAGGNGFKQDFAATTPVSLLMVIDFEKFGKSDTKAMQMGCVDAGNVSENINLYCQSVGLVTVPRATHDTEGIKKLLGFTDKQLPIMNNPVGYEKK